MRCLWCGEPVKWVRCDDKWILIEERLRPYKKDPKDMGRYMYTGSGCKVPGVPLPESRAAEADGFLPCRHWCLKKPIEHRPRATSRRDRWRELTDQ